MSGVPGTGTRVPTGAPDRIDSRGGGRVGDSPQRPDGVLKVTGAFAFSSDLWMDDMLWGATLRSPHPSARIVSIDIGPALATPGVFAVLTADDVPGTNAVGLEHQDQPVLADGVVHYEGEPVALVAAEHPEVARRAARPPGARRRRARRALPRTAPRRPRERAGPGARAPQH